ncbi:Golgi SNAP receptor complex member 1 isoform X3 [Homo sapiens]|uniref:Golgi SNAP receptor complex member 1 isoform X3 n=1 Tax=Homo sapiens TaxID=9606 RepID=UPI0007DC828D|nr:Golgi SNAP receptor complex member 1 isoform X3 [Homo sapiens]XP_054173856.1 Golgi SNAP receptor complex member 1 isoform X3 [Homo sapiens]|eukprot:XP_016880863.1 Golgi SNAP receptor complex member 1 isoform X3 [Homo sapiens]
MLREKIQSPGDWRSQRIGAEVTIGKLSGKREGGTCIPVRRRKYEENRRQNVSYWVSMTTTDLRKQARQLENELDLKLVSFSKLCTSYSHSSTRDGRRDRYSSDTTPLLNGSSQDRMFETMAIEIEQLLARLTGVNDKMAEYTNSAGVPSLNAALMHTLQRHRDILQDYTHEFHKTKANFMAIRERENLMGSVRKDIESYKSGSGVNNRRTELFLKEHDHLRNIAMATKENMTSQRGMLKSIHSKMNTLANRFPAVNSLIQRINLRKRRDSLILGGVIGICTILLLLYAFH